MSEAAEAASEPPWFTTVGPRLVGNIRKLGEQTAFYGQSLAATGDAVRRYPGELLRIIAEMGMGTGALAVVGGTMGIIGFLTLTTGALVAVQGYDTLSNIGVEALTGFLSAFFNVRMIAPCTAGVALAATIGAGTTAQLGAMRITRRSTPSKSWESVPSPTWRRPGLSPASWSSFRSTPSPC